MTQDVVMTPRELGHLRRQLRQAIEQCSARLDEVRAQAKASPELSLASWQLSAALTSIEQYWTEAGIAECERPSR